MIGLVPQVQGNVESLAEILRAIWKEVQADPLPGMGKLSVSRNQNAATQGEAPAPSPWAPEAQGADGDHLDVLV